MFQALNSHTGLEDTAVDSADNRTLCGKNFYWTALSRSSLILFFFFYSSIVYHCIKFHSQFNHIIDKFLITDLKCYHAAPSLRMTWLFFFFFFATDHTLPKNKSGKKWMSWGSFYDVRIVCWFCIGEGRKEGTKTHSMLNFIRNNSDFHSSPFFLLNLTYLLSEKL